ncbi:platelet-activating factor acetylhydrolase IB subunit beta [Folsomia candida]|uniref:Platelet-activating factor acetylhydrolase IB subunit beta n=1 Tax=Folsomia candida TaxID=158441 RepID=A0A226F290_FOLCA|nr:platelet-activating factor acetylhydrolase IB subunit beta [Folsomia candida]OXA63915.1 Platelet-activating factor acetylhydrolase IB subunit beta [Folsomia candida]
MTRFIFLCSILIIGASAQPWVPEPQTQQDWMPWNWMERYQTNVNNTLINGPNINLLFYGDSITEGWDYTGRQIWDTVYAPFGAANYGIGGDATQHVLWRSMNGETENLAPKLCVLKIGTNNVGWYPERDIARGISAIVAELRGRLPTTKILLLGILPRINAEETERVEQINAMVSILDNGNTVRFLNMRDAFYMGNGQFYPGLYSPDLLHLETMGYAKWRETMEPLFLEMWNSEK